METTKTYIICATHRTGSSMLTDVLNRTGVAGEPEEYFVTQDIEGFDTDEFAAYLQKTMARTTTPNGVFGFKLMSVNLLNLLARIREIKNLPEDTPHIDVMRAVFPDLRLIHLDREDILRQAISLTKAQITDTWGLSGGKGSAPKVADSDYDARQIHKNLKNLSRAKGIWEDFFAEAGLEPLRLTYSQIVYNRPEAIRAIYDHVELDAEPVVPETNHRRMADDLSEAWYFRYLTESIDTELREAHRLERQKNEYRERIKEVDALQAGNDQLAENINAKENTIRTLRDELERQTERRESLEQDLVAQQREAQQLKDELKAKTRELNQLAQLQAMLQDPSFVANRVPWRVAMRGLSMKLTNKLGAGGDNAN